MKQIAKLVNNLNEEVNDAKKYSDRYIDAKIHSNIEKSEIYHELANDELRHAELIHQLCVEEINAMRSVITPPLEMLEKWDKAHELYIEKVDAIRRMLAL